MRKTGGVLAAALLVGVTTQADADVGVSVAFNHEEANSNSPEATAVWTYAGLDSGIQGSYGAASADLTSGTLRGFSDLQTPSDTTGLSPFDYPEVAATSSFSDTLTFQGGPGVIDVALSMTIDGDFSATQLPHYGNSATTVDFNVALSDGGGYASTRAEIERNAIDGGDPTTTLMPPPDGVSVIAVLTPDYQLIPPTATITTRISVPVGAQVGVSGSIFVRVVSGTPGIEQWADFGNTARISLSYPAGYTFTSASGFFLTRPDAGGLSLDGGFGGPPDLGGSTSSSTGGTAAGGGTSGSAAGGGSSSGGNTNGGGTGSGSTGGGAAASSSGGTGATPAKSGGCSTGSSGVLLPALPLVVLGLVGRRRRNIARMTRRVLAAALLVGLSAGLSVPAAADVNVALFFPNNVYIDAPEAAALWAYANPDSGIAGSYAAASADLTAGTFRSFTDLQTASVVVITPETGAPSVEASAGFLDFVTFVGDPGAIDISLTMSIDGDFSAGPLPHGTYADTLVDFVVTLDDGGGAGIVSTKAEITRAVYDGGVPKTTIEPGPDGINIIAQLTPDDQLIPPVASITTRMTVPVGAQVAVSGHIYLSTTCITPSVETWADFGSTARVTLGYPAGYTFTSQSGAFLSRPDAGGLSLDGGFGGPPDLGGSTSSSTGGTAAGGGTSGSAAGGGSTVGGSTSGGSASGGTGSGSTGGSAATSSGGSTGTTPAKSGGCSSGGAGGLLVPVLLLGVLGLVTRRRSQG